VAIFRARVMMIQFLISMRDIKCCLSCLVGVAQGFLSPGELDPLNRRLTAEPKPDIVVQGNLTLISLSHHQIIQLIE